MGSGRRHLQANTDFLYENSFLSSCSLQHPPIYIDSTCFKIAEVPNNCELNEFCNNLMHVTNSRVFIEYDDELKRATTEIEITDFVILDKVCCISTHNSYH